MRMGVSAAQRQSTFQEVMMVVVMMMVRWETFTVTFQLAVLQPKS